MLIEDSWQAHSDICLRFVEFLTVAAQDSRPSGSLVLSGKDILPPLLHAGLSRRSVNAHLIARVTRVSSKQDQHIRWKGHIKKAYH